jgi:penicillin-binding protein A
MKAQSRHIFYLFTLGFVALVDVLAYWQVYATDSPPTDPSNSPQSRRGQEVPEVPRELILADGGEAELARSEQEDDGMYSRVYPEGPVYSHVTGYSSTRYGVRGIEIGENSNLSGAGELETLDELINRLQRFAYDDFANRSTGRGSVVALNPSPTCTPSPPYLYVLFATDYRNEEAC